MLDRVLRGGDWELVNSETNLKTAKQITEPNYPTNLVFRRLARQLFNFLQLHARNSSRDSQTKLIVRFVVKWREFREKKKKYCDNFDLLRKTHAML